MMNPNLGRDLAVVCALTTIIFTPSLTIDAFNPPKFLIMCWGTFYIGLKNRVFLVRELKSQMSGRILAVGIVISLLVLGANSYSLSERIFGLERRNFGFITVISFFTLGAIAFAAGRAKVIESRVIYLWLMITNLFVSLIFLLQLSGFAFTEFDNEYGVLPSTLGNPNFLSAFLAVSIVGILGCILHPLSASKWKYLASLQIVVSIWIIAKTESIQGFFALVIGLITVGVILFKTIVPRRFFWFFSTLTLGFAAFIICGILGIGFSITDRLPSTLLFRVTYWKIAFQMVRESPVLGLGFDSYLDNFRGQLQTNYVATLGAGVISDSPHNLFLDFFVSGGLILGLYVAFCLGLSLFKCVKSLNKTKVSKFQISSDEILIVILIMYLALACISPFQLSLFIWLPVVIGLVASFDGYDGSESFESKTMDTEKNFRTTTAGLLSMILIYINPLVAMLPIVTEVRYRSAVESGNFYDLKDVALAWPFSGARANAIAQGMLNSSFGENSSPDESTQKQLQIFRDTAIEIVKSSSTINPNHFETWRFLLANSPRAEIKLLALENLQRLDPYNPEWSKTR